MEASFPTSSPSCAKQDKSKVILAQGGGDASPTSEWCELPVTQARNWK